MEQLIWTLLGYLAMPMIFIVGFALTAAFFGLVLELLDIEPIGGFKQP